MLNKIIYTILGFAIAYIFIPHGSHEPVKRQTVSGVSTHTSEIAFYSAPELADAQIAPILTAKAAMAFDLNSGTILYSKNFDHKLPIASLTKLMTALVVLNRADLNQSIVVTRADQTTVGSTVGLVVGEEIRIRDLLKALLIPSANDAALALANHVGGNLEVFAQEMNQHAAKLGLTSTRFTNPVGWDSDENYSTTMDLIKITQEVLKHKELADIVATKQTLIGSVDGRFSHQLTTTNQLMLEDSEIIGVKTGFTSKALGNLIILDNHDNQKVLTVVLGSQNREDDTRKLLAWLFTVYKW